MNNVKGYPDAQLLSEYKVTKKYCEDFPETANGKADWLSILSDEIRHRALDLRLKPATPGSNGETPTIVGDGKTHTAHATSEKAKISKPDSEPEAEETTKPVFQPLTFGDLMFMPPREYLIKGLLSPGDLCMVFGESGGGKTFFVIDLLISVAKGEKVAGCFEVPRQLNVAYCAGEGLSGLSDRFAAAAGSRNLNDIPNFLFFQKVPQLYLEEYETIDTFVNEYKAGNYPKLDILVIDTFHSATVNADENSSKDAGKILSAVKYAIQELGCAVILVHHTNKSKSGERGSSAYRGAMDLMIEVSQAGTKFFMHCSKLKDGGKFETQSFTLIKWRDSVYVKWDGPAIKGNSNQGHRDDILKELRKRPEMQFTSRQLSEAIGIKPSYTNNLLVQLQKEGKIKRALQDENKQSSSRNPWVYFLKTET